MQIIIPGFGEDIINPVLKSLSIRTCYLLSSQLRLAGNVHYMFDMEEQFRTMSTPDKIEFIISEDKEGDDESKRKFEELAINYKKLKNFKNKDKDAIVNIKKVEHATNKFFELLLKEHMNQMNATQLPQLKSLFEKDSFNYYHVVYDEPETETDRQGSLSKILSLQLDEEDIKLPTMMHLDYEFFNDEFYSEFNYKKLTEKFSGSGFIIPVLKIKNYIWFTVSDIDAMQLRMSSSLNNFREQVSRFVELKNDIVQSYHRFINNVIPASRVLQEMLETDELVKAYNQHAAFAGPNADFCMGMIPWQMMWDYFEFTGLAEESTRQALRKIKITHPLVPVTAMRHKQEFTPREKITEVKQAAALKKSLSID